MFWTAFIWGLGVSSGACFGLLMFFVLKAGLDWLMNTKQYKTIQDYQERTLEALQDRNRLSELIVANLSVIANAARARASNGKSRPHASERRSVAELEEVIRHCKIGEAPPDIRAVFDAVNQHK